MKTVTVTLAIAIGVGLVSSGGMLHADGPSVDVAKRGNDAVVKPQSLGLASYLSLAPENLNGKCRSGTTGVEGEIVGDGDTIEAMPPIAPTYFRFAGVAGAAPGRLTELAMSSDRAPANPHRDGSTQPMSLAPAAGSPVSWAPVARAATAAVLQDPPGPPDSPAEVAASPAPKGDPEDGWRFTLAPYVWLPSATGTATVRQVEFDFGLDPSDIVENLDFALMGHAEVRKGKLAFFHDFNYLDLSADDSITFLRVDSRIKYGQYDVAAAYEVWRKDFSEGSETFAVDLFGGVRAQNLEGKVDLKPGPRFSREESFAELLVGSRAFLRVSEKVVGRARLDFSGFGIGSGSSLTWNLSCYVDYALSKGAALGLGYRIMGLDYSRGTGSSKLAVDAVFSGPVLGVSFNF